MVLQISWWIVKWYHNAWYRWLFILARSALTAYTAYSCFISSFLYSGLLCISLMSQTHSIHTCLIDSVLNDDLHIVAGCLCLTPMINLPILAVSNQLNFIVWGFSLGQPQHFRPQAPLAWSFGQAIGCTERKIKIQAPISTCHTETT